MRLVLLVAAFVCGLIATLIGFEIIDVAMGKATLLTCAWGFWALTLYVLSALIPEVPRR